jgi:hypothetical protein
VIENFLCKQSKRSRFTLKPTIPIFPSLFKHKLDIVAAWAEIVKVLYLREMIRLRERIEHVKTITILNNECQVLFYVLQNSMFSNCNNMELHVAFYTISVFGFIWLPDVHF